jgi:hypothetical protein
MSDLGDDPNEMFIDPILDERTVEELLKGRVPQDREDLAALGALLAEVRSLGEGAPAAPSAALARILAGGVPAADLHEDQAATDSPPATPGRPSWRWVAAVTGLGLTAKIILGLTATAAVAAGAAAAVATDLPEAVFEALGGGERPSPAVDQPQATESGSGVSEDASPSGPGATGPAVPDQASEDATGGLPGASEDAPASATDGQGLDRAREETSDTPAQIPSEVGSDAQGPSPGGASEAPSDGSDGTEGPSEETTDGSSEGTSQSRSQGRAQAPSHASPPQAQLRPTPGRGPSDLPEVQG